MQQSTIKLVLSRARKILESKNIETARLDSEVLLAFSLGINRSEIFKDPDRMLSAMETSKYDELIDRRGQFEPVSYIRGKKEFFSIEFNVDERVMVPRPETELLVEKALELIENFEGEKSPDLIDIGTGSGAIPVSLLKNSKSLSFIYASDKSPDALAVAKSNIEKYGLSKKVKLFESDLFERIEGSFDLIISNPPYIKTRDIDSLELDVRLFEPRLALDGGEDGLKIISLLIRNGIKFLRENGVMLLEIGKGEADLLKERPEVKKYSEIKFFTDDSRVERVIFLRK